MKKGLFLINVLMVWIVVSCESGPTGDQGETGPTGNQGQNGEDGITGQAGPSGINGENGHNGACWDNIPPEIDSITYNSTMYVGGGPYPIIITPNGSHSVEELKFELIAIYGTVTQKSFPNHNQFIFTPVQSGGPLTFIALVSDTCQQDLRTFSVEIYPVVDVDGNGYHTVNIGQQVWLAENLKVTRYRDGSAIPNVNDVLSWNGSTSGAYCNYGSSEINGSIYGRLYNWYAVNGSINICPTGWHVPTDAEWTVLSTYLGAYNGGKMKETGTAHWLTPNAGATNTSGFSALPGGFRYFYGVFADLGIYSFWWSATQFESDNALNRNLHYSHAEVDRTGTDKRTGLSVRCLRD